MLMHNKVFIGKTLIEVCSLHLYASFGTFCIQIGQLFAPLLFFKHSEEFLNQRHLPLKTANCRFSNILQRLTVPRIIDQFGCKRCKKKRTDVNYKLLWELFQKCFVLHGQSAVKNNTYVIRRTVYFGWICMLFIPDSKRAWALLPSETLSLRSQGCNPRYWTMFLTASSNDFMLESA